jgi:hypothetical protein
VWKFLPKFLFNQGLYRLTGRKTLVLISILLMLVWAWYSRNQQPAALTEMEQPNENQMQSSGP